VVVAVLGAGMMGAQIGVEFALHGATVLFVVRDLAAARSRVRDTLERVIGLGLVDAGMATANGDAISIVDDVQQLPPSVEFVLDCLPEDWATKLEVMSAAARRHPSAVMATNTSSFSITALGEGIQAGTRTVGMHYWNPPLLMPLVEITAGDATGPRAIHLATSLALRAGKTPVQVRRDVPGFIWNRLQMAVLREAWWLVEHGVATIEDIDTVTELGLARRWRQAGLFASIYLGNPSQWELIAANLFPSLSDASDARGLAQRVMADSARWADLEARRDAGLALDQDGDDPEVPRD
jgi:3-hydroxybutyryl-CoA dehydrogenase